MKTTLIALSLLCAGFGAGIWVERHFFAHASDAEASTRVSRSVLTQGESQTEPASDAGRGEESAQRDAKPDGHRKAKRSLQELLALSEDHDRHRALDAYAPGELGNLLADLAASEDNNSPRARSLRRVLYHRWADKEPLKALRAALKENDTRLKDEVIHHAFRELARQDVSQATAAFGELQTHRQREEAIEAMAHHAPLEDMGTLAEFFAQEAPHVRSERLFRRWAERDPGSALLQSLAAARGPDAFRAVAEGMAMNDPSSALEWARAADAEHPGTHAMAGALRALTHLNPEEAAALISELPAGHQQNDLVREIARRWSQDDLNAALAWTESLPAPSQREARRELSREWARRDPQAAADYALALPDSGQRRSVLGEIAHQWARQDLDQALDWASTLRTEESVPAMRGVLETVADANPQAAAAMISDWAGAGNANHPDAYGDLAGSLAQRWSESDPLAAAAWAESLPKEGDVQRRAIERVANRWVEQDSFAASEWIGSLPAGELRNVATERLVDHVASSDPDAAYHWALSVNDQGHQTKMLHHVFEQWQASDPQAAQNTLNAAPISSEQRQQLGQIFQESR